MTITINGTTGISGVDGSSGTPAYQGNDANTGISFGTDIVTINTGGTARVTTDASGNVGIGTVSLTYKFEVQGSVNNFFGQRIYNTNAGSSAVSYLQIGNDTNGAATQLGLNSSTNTTNIGGANALYLVNGLSAPVVFGTSNSERMRLDSSGNIFAPFSNVTQSLVVGGNGATSNLGARICVKSPITAGASLNYAMHINDPNTNTAGGLNLIAFSHNSEDYSAGNVRASMGATIDGGGAGSLVFRTGGFGSQATRMTIDSSGNVGIGTTSNLASSKLDVRGRIRTGTGNSSGDSEIVWSNYASATSAWNVSVRTDVGGVNDDLKFLSFDGSGGYQGTYMQINKAGKLLVGTSNSSIGQSGFNFDPNYTSTGNSGVAIQHANGSASGSVYASFFYNAVGTGSITQNGTTAVLYNTSSDYRLKEITGAVTATEAKDFIMALQPKQGTWKADGSKFVGFLAHEFQAVSPTSVNGDKDAVDEDGKPIYQGMQAASSEVMANLIALVQELTARLEALENK
jgi:hypothetical protein